MRSQLTRSVFRRLLSNEGLLFRCPTRASIHYRTRQRNALPSVVRAPTRRTLFGFSSKPARETKEAQLDPGLATMVQLSVRQRLQAQPPPREQLLKAWITFFEYKNTSKEVVNNVQLGHALRTYKYLQSTRQDGESNLNLPQMRKAATVLRKIPKDHSPAHAEFARLLYEDCLLERGRAGNLSDSTKDLYPLVVVLTKTGNSSEARDLVTSQQPPAKVDPDGLADANTRRLWYQVLSGFAEEDNELELLRTWETLEELGWPYKFEFQRIMVTFYASKNNIEATKKWYEKPTKSSQSRFHPFGGLIQTLLRFCVRNNELEWCKTIFRDLLANEPPKEIWDVVLQWAAGALGKGVEDVEKMMEIMIRRSLGDAGPDAETINELVELAMSLNDSYLAERYIALGQKFGIRPNAKTYCLQMIYRSGAKDLRGAQAAYEELQAEEVLDNEDLPAINTYIRALCSAKVLNYERIISITTDLSERQKRLEAGTTCALSKIYLSRAEDNELIDLLQSESYHYTYNERALIREVFMEFCLSPETDTIRSWTAYTILHPLLDETTVAQRTVLMKNFFSRGRCDMASYVFGHMRAHNMPDRRPVLDTYVQCFLGIASCADREALDMVHNMLKMDSNIEPTTALYNSLMLAYTACEDADRALGFWDDITNSREGPSYQSLEIVFWACSRKHFGDVRAREIWSKMRRMEIEVTGKVFSAYVGSLAGHGKLDEAKGVCEQVPKELGTFYNAIPGQNRKDLVEEWAKDNYPDAWKELEKLGRYEHEEGHMLFNMKREFKA
ncbi:related to complex I intermediate-associated protein 84, mitochondrial precursor [Phialocephala subalpina]|uniref:Related to complex I intermediate-associated protein 84, mitochondrial n=1 Tax=Phialocephala subalpina TaxID=576137 RepID=A0A1L7X6W8_9HELO|nr:related to complex I intermediate-associated protein 84, mitochondrial precursor [Phialocephala subalpina]